MDCLLLEMRLFLARSESAHTFGTVVSLEFCRHNARRPIRSFAGPVALNTRTSPHRARSRQPTQQRHVSRVTREEQNDVCSKLSASQGRLEYRLPRICNHEQQWAFRVKCQPIFRSRNPLRAWSDTAAVQCFHASHQRRWRLHDVAIRSWYRRSERNHT